MKTMIQTVSLTKNWLLLLAHRDNFFALLTNVYGRSFDRSIATTIQQQWTNQDFTGLPRIQVISQDDLNGARGAFATDTNTIYLSQALVESESSEAVSAVLLEELGHWLDTQLNQQDTVGDEGELFSALARKISLNEKDLQRIRAENDHAEILIEGQYQQVEQSAGSTALVSHTPSGAISYGGSPSISADGNYTVFISDSSDLVLGDYNQSADIFIYNRLTDKINIVDYTSGSDVFKNSPSVSADGRYIVYSESTYSSYGGSTSNIVLFDRNLAKKTIVTKSTTGGQANDRSFNGIVSANGQYVALVSSASNLVSGDRNGKPDLFLHNVSTGSIQLIDTSLYRSFGDRELYLQAISNDGRYLTFSTVADDEGYVSPSKDYVYDRIQKAAFLVGNSSYGGDAYTTISVSDDGRFFAFDGVRLYDRLTGASTQIGGGFDPHISGDGNYVVFYSFSSTGRNVNLYERLTGRSTTIANTRGLQTYGSGLSTSGDGQYISFVKYENYGKNPLYLYDRGAVNSTPGGGTIWNDRLKGTGKKDVLNGSTGDDFITGLGKNDVLIGGIGRDKIKGGKGKDRFVFDINTAFDASLMGKDRLIDFKTGQDKIVLDRTTFTALRGKRLKFASVKTVQQAKKSPSQITYVRGRGDLFYNPNGTAPGFGTGGQFADFRNGTGLAPRDFSIIS
jgi:Ca2+-binding RTX toxin-like protein